MKGIKKNLSIIILFGSLIIAAIFSSIYDYYDIYLLSLNGRVTSKRTDIKEAMYLTVSKKEHNLAHNWPKLQELVEVGDSVFKKPKDYDVILIKKDTHKPIKCKLK